jgi:lipopolysaccharide export system protein LptA
MPELEVQMKYTDSKSYIFGMCLLVVLTLGGTITAKGAADAPIHIEANKMTSTEKTNSVIFSGDVDAKQGDVRIRTDEMTVFYTPGAVDQEKKGEKKAASQQKTTTQQVEKLICVGNVELTRGQWLGTAKKMVYLSKERQVILTDNAKAWQGQNMVSGDKIIYYLDEGRSEVFSNKSEADKNKPSRVNMTIIQN